MLNTKIRLSILCCFTKVDLKQPASDYYMIANQESPSLLELWKLESIKNRTFSYRLCLEDRKSLFKLTELTKENLTLTPIKLTTWYNWAKIIKYKSRRALLLLQRSKIRLDCRMEEKCKTGDFYIMNYFTQ